MVVHTRKAATNILNGRSIDRLYNSFIRSVPTLTSRARIVGISSPFVPHVPMGNQIKRERERERVPLQGQVECGRGRGEEGGRDMAGPGTGGDSLETGWPGRVEGEYMD